MREATDRQKGALTLAALSAPVALSLSCLSWQWALLGGVLAALQHTILYNVCRRPLAELVTQAFGKAAGKTLLALTLAWTVFAAACAASAGTSAYPQQKEQYLATLSILILSCIAGRGGWKTVLRVGGVLFLFLAGGYLALILCAGLRVHPQWCAPWGTSDQAATALAVLLAAQSALYLPSSGKAPRLPLAWALTMALAPAAVSCVTSGVLSPQVARTAPDAFYRLGRSLRLEDRTLRFEPIISAMLLTGFFCLTALLTQSAAEIARVFLPQVEEKRVHTGVCVLTFAALSLTGHVSESVRAILAGVCWGLIPVTTLLVVCLKKWQKKVKKSEKRA